MREVLADVERRSEAREARLHSVVIAVSADSWLPHGSKLNLSVPLGKTRSRVVSRLDIENIGYNDPLDLTRYYFTPFQSYLVWESLGTINQCVRHDEGVTHPSPDMVPFVAPYRYYRHIAHTMNT